MAKNNFVAEIIFNVDINLDTELNDGCASQFKIVRAVQRFATRNI